MHFFLFFFALLSIKIHFKNIIIWTDHIGIPIVHHFLKMKGNEYISYLKNITIQTLKQDKLPAILAVVSPLK
ncbi:MAG: hypothetical protein CNLJKLNK_00921 [Holosporales bacterium]